MQSKYRCNKSFFVTTTYFLDVSVTHDQGKGLSFLANLNLLQLVRPLFFLAADIYMYLERRSVINV